MLYKQKIYPAIEVVSVQILLHPRPIRSYIKSKVNSTNGVSNIRKSCCRWTSFFAKESARELASLKQWLIVHWEIWFNVWGIIIGEQANNRFGIYFYFKFSTDWILNRMQRRKPSLTAHNSTSNLYVQYNPIYVMKVIQRLAQSQTQASW